MNMIKEIEIKGNEDITKVWGLFRYNFDTPVPLDEKNTKLSLFYKENKVIYYKIYRKLSYGILLRK